MHRVSKYDGIVTDELNDAFMEAALTRPRNCCPETSIRICFSFSAAAHTSFRSIGICEMRRSEASVCDIPAAHLEGVKFVQDRFILSSVYQLSRDKNFMSGNTVSYVLLYKKACYFPTIL